MTLSSKKDKDTIMRNSSQKRKPELIQQNPTGVCFDMMSLGRLRRDLVSSIGVRGAKRIITRYGYSYGLQMASSSQCSSLSTKGKGDRKRENEEIAQALCSIGATAELSDANTTEPKAITLVLRQSPEADQHLLYLDEHDSPVCWFTSGFATGYASVMFPDEKLIFMETTCRGNGENICVLSGKTKEEWGEHAFEELDFFKDVRNTSDGMMIEPPEYQAKINTIVQSISQLVLDENTDALALQNAVDELSAMFGCTVVIEELGMVTHSCVHKHDKNSDGNTVACLGGLSLQGSRSFTHASSYYESKRRSFLLNDDVSGSNIIRLVCPILANEKKLGFLSMIRINYPFSQSDMSFIEEISDLFGIHIAEQRRFRELEGKLTSSFIDDLITDSHRKSNPALDYSKELHFDFSIPSRMIVVEIDDPAGKVPPATRSAQADDWIQAILRVAKRTSLGDAKMLIVYRDKHLVAILQDALDSSLKHALQLSEKVMETLAVGFPSLIFTVGIGSLCQSVDDCMSSFDSACKVLELGKKLGRENEVLSLEQFSARTLLYTSLDTESMIDFAALRLKPIMEYDKNNSVDLLPTLETFVENRGNSHRTAEELSLSSSGLKHRLKNIEKLIGQSLRETRTLYDLAISFDILHLFGSNEILNNNHLSEE